MAHPGGRPTKYQESFIQEVDNYLQTTGREQTSLPTKQGLALHLKVDEDTLNNWAKVYPKFFGALKKLMATQAKQLIDDGIYGGKEVNSTIVKLLLQNNHGMKERTDTTTNDKDLPTPILGGISQKKS
jgi:hypothetical protein